MASSPATLRVKADSADSSLLVRSTSAPSGMENITNAVFHASTERSPLRHSRGFTVSPGSRSPVKPQSTVNILEVREMALAILNEIAEKRQEKNLSPCDHPCTIAQDRLIHGYDKAIRKLHNLIIRTAAARSVDDHDAELSQSAIAELQTPIAMQRESDLRKAENQKNKRHQLEIEQSLAKLKAELGVEEYDDIDEIRARADLISDYEIAIEGMQVLLTQLDSVRTSMSRLCHALETLELPADDGESTFSEYTTGGSEFEAWFPNDDDYPG